MIEIQNLSAGYNKSPVIQNINMKVKKASIVCIIGPNGCGKSTLLKCIARQLPVMIMSGNIFIDNQPISNISGKDYAKKTAFLKQSADLPVITAESLVLHGRFPYLGFPRKYSENDKEKAKTAMQKTGVWDLRHKMLSELSGGEAQKVYLAMALAQDTDILLLDEPATFLDIRSQLELLKLICELKNDGKTIFTVLHNISDAVRIADVICLMKHGKIVFFGSPAELLEKKLIDEVFDITAASAVIEGEKHLFFKL